MLSRLSQFKFSESVFPFRPLQDACLWTRLGVYNLSLLYPILKHLPQNVNRNIWKYTFSHLYSKQSESIIYVHEQNHHEFDRDKQAKIILRKLDNVKELQFSIDSILKTDIQQKYHQLQEQINKTQEKDQDFNELLQRLEIQQSYAGNIQEFLNNLYKSTTQDWQFNKDQISEYSNFIFRLNKIIEKSQQLGVKLVIDTEGVLPLQIYFQQFDIILIVKQISQIKELLNVTGKADVLFHETYSQIDSQSDLFQERRIKQLKELVQLAQTSNLSLTLFNPDDIALDVLNNFNLKFIEGLNEHQSQNNLNVRKASLDGYALDYLNQLDLNIGLQNKLILDEFYYRSVFNS
ncbi:hypothetical protein pb186bvf_007286 [Paramecium bursaria]